MPQITQIKSQKSPKSPIRVNVYLNNQFAFALPVDTLVKAGLKVGQEISQDEVEKLRNKDIEEKLYQKALFLISRRPRSEKEIRDYLCRKKANLKSIDFCLKKLKQQKFLNDEEFAFWFVEQRITFRPKGQQALLFELRQKGIAREIAEKAVTESIDELSLAKNLLQKKILYPERSRRAKTPNFSDRQKLVAYLSRRGFSWETIKTALDDFLKKS